MDKPIVIPFDKLSAELLYQLLHLRSEIFVVEQNCVYNDLDQLDQTGLHALLVNEQMVIAYARILPPQTKFKTASISRVVVKANERGKGVATRLLVCCLEKISECYGADSKVSLSAQSHLIKWYERIGFQVNSEEYLEDGIPHTEMIYIPPSS